MEPEPTNSPGARPGRFTVDELGRKVGMSARNIRAYQTRGLLPPPVRSSRNAYYHDGHVRRLEAIQELQRKGYNLVAIATILGVRDQPPDELAEQLDRLLAQQPVLCHALIRHGVVVRDDDGQIQTVRHRVLRAAFALSQEGIQPGPALQLLSKILDQVMPVAGELIGTARAQAVSDAPSLRDGEISVVLAERLAVLVTEAFRVAMENSGHAWAPVSGRVR